VKEDEAVEALLRADRIAPQHVRNRPLVCNLVRDLRGSGKHRGTPMEPDNLRRSWGAIRKAAGLGDMRFHDLRHTCVTLLLNLGVPPQVVRDIVGHSDIEVTMTIYAHVSLDDKRNALGKLGDALG
jgi:integrase